MENKILVNARQFFAMQGFLKPGIMSQTTLNYLYAKNGAIYAARATMLAVLHLDQDSKLEGIIARVPEPKKVGNEAMLSFVQCNDKALLAPENIQYEPYQGAHDYRIADLEALVGGWEASIDHEKRHGQTCLDVDLLQDALKLIKKCSGNKSPKVKFNTGGAEDPTIIEYAFEPVTLKIYLMPCRF